MSTIRIVTDSTADLPLELVQEYNIKVVPLRVYFNEETYREGIDISPNQFYKKLKEYDKLPTTSQPPPGDFVAAYKQLVDEGAEYIFSIHLSKKFSGTYQCAFLAKSMVNDVIEVEVIDSRSATMGIGLVVLEAARAAKEGKSINEIKDLINKLINKIKVFFLVDSLENLQKGGRIGKASYLLGSLLNIKPILTVQDGEVHGYEKVRGREEKAFDRIVEILQSQIPQDSKVKCAIVHCDDLENAHKLKLKVLNTFNCPELLITEMGAVIGTHVGTGTIGVVYYVI